MRTKTIRTLFIALCASATTARGQEIDIRLSIKYILDAGNNRPSGQYATEQNVRDVIEETNRALRRWGRGYRYVILENAQGEFDEVSQNTVPGSSQFFSISPGSELGSLEAAAVANPTGYFWRTDAINVYIVNCCAAGAAIPSSNTGERAVYFSADINRSSTDPGQHARQVIWAHELGHHFDLIHPWDGDGVSDTRDEPSPLQCSGSTPCPEGFPCSSGGSSECCCSLKVANLTARAASQGWTQQEFEDLRYNVMGYMAAVDCVCLGEEMVAIDNMRLSEGQLDRWTDATRRYHSNEVSGLTYFVDWRNTTSPYNGYSADPYRTVLDGVNAANTGGGKIVLIRDGSYNETLTIAAPVTLRSGSGIVSIGQ